MHELSLHGVVLEKDHERLVQQLAGLASMQPQHVRELHLVFKARPPGGLQKVQGNGGSSGTAQQQQEVQKLKTMLQSGIFYVQLIGSISQDNKKTACSDSATDEIRSFHADAAKIDWTFEFKDTPEAAKQPTTTRIVSRTQFEGGEMLEFLHLLGYEYINRYAVEGDRFYTRDTTLFLHRVRQLPKAQETATAGDLSRLPAWQKLPLLDPSGAYVLQAHVEIADGNSQDLRDRATRQLMSMRETLKSEVDLKQPDRLALDTRVPITMRRV